jgi:hypothetical protein
MTPTPPANLEAMTRHTALGFRPDRLLVGGRSRAAERSSMWRELATLVANHRDKQLAFFCEQGFHKLTEHFH